MCRVLVLMSTYNGEKYIQEQVDSIMQQQEVIVDVYIRDDGSSDTSREVIDGLKDKYGERIVTFYEKNVGYKRSFLMLLEYVSSSGYDYYAFSDQDDVWLPTKIYKAVSILKNGFDLYVSGLIIADEKLNEIGKKDFSERKKSLEAFFVRNSFPGCAMVFNRKVLQYTKRIIPYLDEERIPSHDFIVSCMAQLVGNIFLDNNPMMMHRRTGDSITAGAKGIKGIIKRIRVEKEYLINNKCLCSSFAKSLIDADVLDDNTYSFMKTVEGTRKSFSNKLRLIMDTNFSCGIFICDIEVRLKILIGNY